MTSHERFMNHVRKIETGCWIWTGSLNTAGYGTFRDGGRTWLAHRWSYEHIGKRPATPELHHKCKVRACVNPNDVVPTNPLVHPDKPSVLNLLKSTCPQGHPYDAANTYLDPKTGSRHCRTCRRKQTMESYWRRWKKARAGQAAYYQKNRDAIRKARRDGRH